jgi:hypothetical protein
MPARLVEVLSVLNDVFDGEPVEDAPRPECNAA